jgi:two-component system sensor histidine kinase UhpB
MAPDNVRQVLGLIAHQTAMAKLPDFRESLSRNRRPAMGAKPNARKPVMPLRVRLITLIGLVLLASLACGSVLVGWHAANSVRTELRAALDVGSQTIRNGTDELAGVDDRVAALRHLVATFNGNRHVRASLIGADGQAVATSVLFPPAQLVPGWFHDLIGGDPVLVRLDVPQPALGPAAIVLQADATNEVSEVWGESRDAVLVLAGFALLSALLSCIVVGRALRPLEHLADAFDQIGDGNYHGSVPERGPPELIRLANGFNAMTRRIAAAAAQNRRLNERLLTLQAEERADLARDLHDEIGPLLFAVDMTAATIERLAGDDRAAGIPTHVRSIQDAVGRIQRHVRMLLGRLRPMQAIGLEVAIERLVAFWRSRNPDLDFAVAVSVDEDRLGDDLKETIYRIIQEGMSNAIRHGRPTLVEVAVAPDDADGIRVEVADDGIGMTTDGLARRDPSQLGLIGMQERVMAMAGSLSLRPRCDGRGVALTAWLPCEGSLQSQNLEQPE